MAFGGNKGNQNGGDGRLIGVGWEAQKDGKVKAKFSLRLDDLKAALVKYPDAVIKNDYGKQINIAAISSKEGAKVDFYLLLEVGDYQKPPAREDDDVPF